MKEFVMDLSGKVANLIGPYFEDFFVFIAKLFLNNQYIAVAAGVVLLAFLVIVGLIASLKRIPKLFLLLVVLLGLVAAASYFIIQP